MTRVADRRKVLRGQVRKGIKVQPVYHPLYLNNGRKMIVLVTGGRGCERPDQEIIMADLTIKQIKDIKVGDKVMGDDGTPRNVIGTCHGYSAMYKVHQTSAEDYLVNDAHIISVRKSQDSINEGRYPNYAEFTDMNVVDFMNSSNRFRDRFRGYKSNSIPYPEKEVLIEPYMLGLWLGDGTAMFPQITTEDEEIKDYLIGYTERNGLTLTINNQSGNTVVLRLKKVCGKVNPFMEWLRHYDLIQNKYIPQDYISNSEKVRLELLAGLIDTDGHMVRNGYEITQKNYVLAKQIKYVADTLGFRTSINEKKAYCNGKDCGIVYRVHVNGDVWRIPCRIERKKVLEENVHKNKDWHLSQLSVEPAGDGEWCGICLDGNQRYLHSDGTVTHNSGKSFNVETFLERLTFEAVPSPRDDAKLLAHQILCARYTMVSADISVIPEFLEKIEMEGTQKYFRATKKDVINKQTGSHIMFRGIKTSSGNQTAKLKSIHGLTVFVCDEAEEWTSFDDFEKIMLSIRTLGIQNLIIIVMNPTDSGHFIYQKYIKDTHRIEYFDGVPVQISTHPDVLHIHTTYLDNIENLSPQFLENVETMKRNDPERYAHIVIGQWADVAEGAVFKKWGIVKEFPTQCKHVALGIDFGYTHDPTAIVMCGIWDNRLYIKLLCYRTGMLSKDIIEFLKPYSGLMVFADSADPRLIDEIALGGIMIYPVQKPNGSIVAGIDKMQSYDDIFVTEDSIDLQEELRNYVWDKDKDGNYINVPVDKWNHAIDAARYYTLGKLLGKIVKNLKVTKKNSKIAIK